MKTANTTYRYYNFVHILYLRNECLSVFCFSLPLRAIVFLCYFFFLSFFLWICVFFSLFFFYFFFRDMKWFVVVAVCRRHRVVVFFFFSFFMFNFFFDEFSVAPKRAWLYWYWNGRLVVFVPSFESHSFLFFYFIVNFSRIYFFFTLSRSLCCHRLPFRNYNLFLYWIYLHFIIVIMNYERRCGVPYYWHIADIQFDRKTK